MSQAHKILSHKTTQAFSTTMQAGFDSLRLEGIQISEIGITDLFEYEQGRLSKKELIDRALSRVKSKSK